MDPSSLTLGTSRIQQTPRALRVLSIDLVVIEGPSRGLRVQLQEDVARVGSAPGNQLALADPTVSRAHCELRLRAETVLIKDCGSTNGTFVEGVQLREGEVKPGTAVRVGNSVFRIESAGLPSFVPVSSASSFGELIGESLEMRRVYAVLERLAGLPVTLLIEGETGTGKDVAARSLHAASPRKDGPFVPVDCGAIPENLFESELFGHVRGAFSGALHDRRGVFEEAHGGTLFLDEVGEIPLGLQAKLLRVLETRSVRRVGSNQERPIDVRIIAATNRPLAAAANAGTFREDLYYRLAVVELRMPSLRARSEDVPLLARHFFERFAPGRSLPDSFLQTLATRAFPGNVRELRNFIERSVSLGFVEDDGAQARKELRQAVGEHGLESIVPLHLPLKDARQVWTESFEHIYVRSMLKKTNGNLTHAAELSGVNRRFLQRLVARLGLRSSEPSEADDEKP
jgi:transcriptional regulator with PAS, ATPase and Fis domain